MVKRAKREYDEDDDILQLTQDFIDRILDLVDEEADIDVEEVYEVVVRDGRVELRPWRGEEFVVAGIRI